ncbi:MAG: PA2779 family protein [Gammaproteobacteria bacterium]|nr:PA2779 family protein [Gammaproteobacteria bacterium]
MTRTLVRSILTLTLGAMVMVGVPRGAWAGMIGMPAVVAAEADAARAADLALVQSQLARADVQKQLQVFGVDPADAAARAASLSSTELAELAQRMRDAPAGGDMGFLAVIGVVFLVLLLLDYLNVIHVFRSHK